MVAERARQDDAAPGQADGSVRVPAAPVREGAGAVLARALAAMGAAGALLLATPPYGWWALAPVSVALAVLAVRGTRLRRAAWLGLLMGATLMYPLMTWQQVIGMEVWVAVAAAESLYYAPLAVGLALVTRLRGWPVWAAGVWVAAEALRGRFPLGGFTWGRLAFSQPQTPFTGYASWGSAPLVDFAVVLTGALLAALALRWWTALRGGGGPRAALRPTALVLAAVFAIAAVGALAPRLGAPTVDRVLTAGVVQGNVPQTGLDILGERQQVLNNHMAATADLAARVRSGEFAAPDFVVLPESASDIDLYRDPAAHDLVQRTVDDLGVPILIGTNHYTDDGSERQIVSVLWEPGGGGPGDYYAKRHLVPFGEYVPYREQLMPLIPRLEEVGSQGIPGDEPGVLEVNGTTVAVAICFDIAFDSIVREAVLAGGEVLVEPTNNANYNFTGQSEQQLAISRLRAVEHGRPVLIAATSGISAIVQPDGSVDYRSEEFVRDVAVGEVPAMSGFTVATRLGAAPEWALAALGVGAALAGALARRGARS
ncbi:apolipoprotein N-acyltransferase [Allonocardiopsis opalescens]|uniref:Apolipoprotein N-acyltransferase n=1 Tax=Allonocardiopsis opalescens TaxID=1144618 RepID=A0A2T0PTU5_9ACTN|nr:apolipoprotein N-acyltransferase [Allonocardiopsis opalescens]PRX92323.1 apolipoprotein N-acyltransferase [Allonocardiopsis opalescens]